MHLWDAIQAEMRITALGDREVRTNSRKVLLTDLSPNRLCFKTTLWLPPAEDWSVSLRFAMEGISMAPVGKIKSAWDERHWWNYDVELGSDPVGRILITRALNQRLRTRSPVLYRIHETYRKQIW